MSVNSSFNSESTPRKTSVQSIDDTREILADIANESILSEQEELYGEVKPAPTKLSEPTTLPKLRTKLTVPKRRSSTNGSGATMFDSGSPLMRRKRKLLRHIPIKHARNFTSPLPMHIKNLGSSPIPNLSPNGEVRKAPKKSKYGDIMVQKTPITRSVISPNTSLHIAMPGSYQSPLAVRSFSSPPADMRVSNKIPIQIQLNQLSKMTYVEESMRHMDREILKYKQRLEKLEKIKAKRAKSSEKDELEQLIEKWRKAAQAASNYMMNEAQLKIDRMGGIEEYRKKQNENKLRRMRFKYDNAVLPELEQFMESDQYKHLDKYQKEEFLGKKRKMEKLGEEIESGEYKPTGDNHVEEDTEFSMKELYRQLHLDYDLVYRKKTD